MDTTIKILTASLLALVALAGGATAQSCPECDEDGAANAQNSYHSVDAGLVDENATALADTDAAADEKQSDGGFFAWLSICLHAFVQKVEDLTGLETGVDGNAEAYASEDGVDVDVTVRAAGEVVDFDDGPAGDVDGMTWEAMGEASATVRSANAQVPDLPHVPDTDLDVCVSAEVEIVGCL